MSSAEYKHSNLYKNVQSRTSDNNVAHDDDDDDEGEDQPPARDELELDCRTLREDMKG